MVALIIIKLLSVLMPHYKLVYFDFKNRGELIRLIFAAAGVEFEDYRIPLDEPVWIDWNAYKPSAARASYCNLKCSNNTGTC